MIKGRIKAVVILLLSLPMIWMLLAIPMGRLGAEPIKELQIETGTWAMRMAAYSSMGRSRRNEGGQAALAMLVIGFLLMILGFVGVFFGNIIKAGLSRQREYLADASAVQFTRNRDGISGALKKIHAHVNAPNASPTNGCTWNGSNISPRTKRDFPGGTVNWLMTWQMRRSPSSVTSPGSKSARSLTC